MKARIKKNPVLIAWVDASGKIQFMSNMNTNQKKLVMKSLSEEPKIEKI